MAIDSTSIAVVGTLLGGAIGATIGLFEGPVKDYYADRAEKKLRKALYGELITAFEQIDGALLDYCSRCNSKNMDFYGQRIRFVP